MTPLDVAAPELTGKPADAPQLEQPVEVKLAALHFPDGAEATDAEAQVVGAYVYRVSSAGEQLWNEKEQSWTDAPDDLSALPPLALQYKAGDALPWRGLLVAIGMKDKDGNDRFAVASGSEPRYRLRAYGRFKRDDGDYAGLSVPSAEISFVSAADSRRFSIDMQPDPDTAQEVTLVLKNASLAKAGYVKISTTGGQVVEIGNLDPSGAPLALVQLAADGSILLQPAAGKKIVLQGDLEAQRIRYQPSGGGAAADL
jgi:hypothetical protein